jgi:hypothetical protein
MGLHISDNLVLGQLQVSSGNAAVLGYKNEADFNNISATSETVNNPATNMINPATAFAWQASSNADQTITIETDGAEIDFIGIARHNLFQQGLTVTVKFNGVVVVPETPTRDSQVIMYVVNSATPDTITIEIKGATVAPTIAVLYAGKAVVFERNIYVGHTPITYARERDELTGTSQDGEYLGNVVRNEIKRNQVDLKNLTPNWYRQELDPFLKQSPRVPAFFAWRPESFPFEVGYVWVKGNPKPVNQRANGMMSISLNLEGIA